jgi:hypothetical protein
MVTRLLWKLDDSEQFVGFVKALCHLHVTDQSCAKSVYLLKFGLGTKFIKFPVTSLRRYIKV